MERIKYGAYCIVGIDDKRLIAIFYKNASGKEPVRDWIKALTSENRKIIGSDIKTVEFGWPVGMPVCKPLGKGLYEVRSSFVRGEKQELSSA